jgi:hypothetical protein
MGKGTRWFLFSLGLLIVTIGLSTALGALLSTGTSLPESGQAGGFVGLAIGIAFYVTGCMLCISVARTAAAVMGALAAPVGVVSAAGLALLGMVLDHADPVNFDGPQAAHMAWIGAALCLAIALGGALNWWHWLSRRGSQSTVRHLKQLLVIGYGGLFFCNGLFTAFVAVTGMFTNAGLGHDHLHQLWPTVAAAGTSVIYLGAGAVFVWHGAASLTGVPSGRLHLPPLGAVALAALVAIGLGELMLQSGAAVGFMPLAHAAAVALPGLAILTLAGRGENRLPAAARATWRELLTMAGYGAAVAASIAGVLNGLALGGVPLAVLAARGAFDGVSSSQELADRLHYGIDGYLSQTDILLVLLAVIAVLGPFNEEFWKGYGVRMLRGAHLTRYRAFLFGAASGVGFGAVEANEYGTGAFFSSPFRWWDGVLLRGGASSLHALASGTVGLGWYYFMTGRRVRGALLYLLAVGMHGSWNAINVLASARAVPWFKDLSDHSLEIALEVAVGVLAAGVLVMIWRLSTSLADEEPGALGPPAPPAPTEPPASPQPAYATSLQRSGHRRCVPGHE